MLADTAGVDRSDVKHLRESHRLDNLDPTDEAILQFVGKQTLALADLTAEDLQRLRDAGLTERQVYDVVMIGAYFNFCNRVTAAFGVEPDEPYGAMVETIEMRSKG